LVSSRCAVVTVVSGLRPKSQMTSRTNCWRICSTGYEQLSLLLDVQSATYDWSINCTDCGSNNHP